MSYLHLFHNVITFNDVTKDNVLAIKPSSLSSTNEELRSISLEGKQEDSAWSSYCWVRY